MKVYLSGPMTGYPDHNKAAFDSAAEALRSIGFEVISPAELDHNAGVDLTGSGWEVFDDEYEQFIERDLDHLAQADAIVLLPGWSKSGGAGREGERAIKLGMPLFMWFPGDPNHITATPTWLFEKYHTTTRLAPDSAGVTS